MKNEERDKFLTEVMGLKATYLLCDYKTQLDQFANKMPNFSTWEGFGKLFEFCQKQEWWRTFSHHKLFETSSNFVIPELIVNPDKFANAVYEFLKEKEN